ncbi:MAG TPA: DUF4282 domain-containing protein [Pirellulaceae bacterium]|jgi:hypothetical protein|nr:DUF4282 domain-containing protein [Pirellulaceae bacterium]
MRAAVLYCKTCRVPVARLPLTAPAVCPRCNVRVDSPNESTAAASVPAKSAPPLLSESKTTKPSGAAYGWAEEATPLPQPSQGRPSSAPRARPAAAARQAYPRAVARSFEPATGLLDIFDWRFKKYLTPYIVRAAWIFCLFVSALWLGMIGLSTALMLAPDPPQRSSTFDRSSFESPRYSPPTALQKALGSEVLPRIFALVMGVTSAVGVLLTLLFMRVLLESVIVLFNIAATLVSIETEVGRRRLRFTDGSAT